MSNRFHGKVIFSLTEDRGDGVFRETYTERCYYGDITKNYRRWDANSNVNDNLNISNTISIVADSFAYKNVGAIKYVEYMGVLWKVNDISVERPRLVLSIGGLYNESEDGTSDET